MKFLKKILWKRQQRRRNYEAAAALDRHTANHFAQADNRDADTLISVALPILRNRARYEIRNNSYAKGMIDTLADDIVGTGPRLQVRTELERFNKAAETEFATWADDADLAGKMSLADQLRLAVIQLVESGEVLFSQQNYSDAQGVQLRLLMIEPDRLATPCELLSDPNIREGVEANAAGRPEGYYIQKKHPGDKLGPVWTALNDFDRIGADKILHLYRQDRPGQTRGVPWITPSLPLFAYLRRYTLAVIAAAETAADLAAVIEAGAADLDPTDVADLDEIEIARNAMMTLPAGWKMSQFKSEQPATTYKEFKAEILNEIARPLRMPFNVAAGNSAGYNYASGRLDWQVYYKFISATRGWFTRRLLTPILLSYLTEARRIKGLLPLTVQTLKQMAAAVEWIWPGSEHVDPQKEANGQKVRLESMTTTLADECGKAGKDWEAQLKQLAREKEMKEELGLSSTPASEPGNQGQDDDLQQDDKDEEDEDEKENVA